MTRLAVCIPTYNRAGFIEETLRSVLGQATGDIEICLSDNASTDNTVAVARRVLAGFPNVRIAVSAQNLGADTNYLSAVSLSTSPFCIILGSDDTLAPDALAAILRRIDETDPDIIVFDRQMCAIDMRPLRVEHMLRDVTERTFELGQVGAFDSYLGNARSLCAAFSYISGIVFRKSAWDAATDAAPWVGSAYVHSYKLFHACIRGARLHYLPLALVNCRLGNDSFRDRGLCRRVLIDLDGFARLANLLATNGQARAGSFVRALIREEYPFWRIVRYQRILGRDPLWPGLLTQLRTDYGFSALRLRGATTLGRIPGVARLSFILRDFTQKLSSS